MGLSSYLKTDRQPPVIPAQAVIQTPGYLPIPQTVLAPMLFEIVSKQFKHFHSSNSHRGVAKLTPVRVYLSPAHASGNFNRHQSCNLRVMSLRPSSAAGFLMVFHWIFPLLGATRLNALRGISTADLTE